MEEKYLEEAQKEMLEILSRIKHFLDSGKYETAKKYVHDEYYILKNDLSLRDKPCTKD